MKNYLLAIDQGTTGSRAFIFDAKGRVVAKAYQEFRQYFPKAGWVEHDALEIWQSCVEVIHEALKEAEIDPRQIAGIGITNQRETTVLWDRLTSIPVARAICWQCRRTQELCQKLLPHRELFRRKTGLVLDPYFSGTKIKWLLDSIPGLRKRSREGKICFGTIDSWLIWKLTGGKIHATDFTNASRTLIFNIQKLAWDRELLKILDIPDGILPEVQASGSVFGYTAKGIAGLPSGIPIVSVLGDQQAALYGQGCYAPGQMKNTYGTGCFLMMNTGQKLIYSKKGLLTTIAADSEGKPCYALEGAVFVAGAVVQWLRDQLKIIKSSSETEAMVKDVPDTNGVYFVPAFVGLGAPYWEPQARGTITGLTRGAHSGHIVRAALESIAYQTLDVFDLMQVECQKKVSALKVDGGACRNNFLMQFQADILGRAIVRPRMIDSTVQGAAYLAGVTLGLWKGQKDLARLNQLDHTFKPRMPLSRRNYLYQGWRKAVQVTMSL